MENILDNLAWSALASGNSKLSFGNEFVKFFDKDVAPFVGLQENSDHNFRILFELISHHNPVVFISTQEPNIDGGWEIIQCLKGFQLVYEGPEFLEEKQSEIVQLNTSHVPQMLALTRLTNPGPFAARTIEFGHYFGIFNGEELIAMAGQRLNPAPFAEISAVCTHPSHVGKGYAKGLLRHQVNRIKASAEIPFLHVRSDNERAINVYQSLGFVIRKEIFFYILRKQVHL